ncbi:uncharacterized protein BT62DRAFT_1079115 [Guyanagaster necrorhizus]|uniref:Protein kinase domain-containing protein n=1 Tax=Guyanagaster necrorhizus TaxID=856835 RepID=A0A9P7VKE1_9AGAR|nr:uncharacterized protein BT62DRAFT_1079115 [Guyanagaster necrorhizus MCA 3950]KAG7442741.1 hypothetical protein BT62DRAFT_1079115 [Guyanagaster necrorhizus MCA 3950]
MNNDRERVILHEWPRDPDGPTVREPPPQGVRTPNNMPWGHTLDDFYWIRPFPGVKSKVIWTRSMLDEFGENFGEQPGVPQVEPRRLRPWPLLKVPNDDALFGLVDETCNRDHSLKPRRFHAVKSTGLLCKRLFSMDTHPLAVFESTEEKIEWSAEPALMNDDAPPGTEESILEGAVKSQDRLVEDDGKDDESAMAEVFVQADDNITGGFVLESSIEGETGDRQNCTEIDVPEIIVEERCEDRHDVVTEDDTKKDESEGSKVIVETHDDLTPAERQAMESFMTTDYETVQKLEERIPEEYFPDILLVNDPSGFTMSDVPFLSRPSRMLPVRYKRVWPKLKRDGEPATLFNNDLHCSSAFHWTLTQAERYAASECRRIATLDLSGAPLLGKGGHSAVRKAGIRLPVPLTTQTGDPHVSVAAKLAFSLSEDRELLENEGRIYDAFPDHLQESYCGYNLVASMDHPVPVGACVPKFFGYYVPVQEEEEASRRQEALNRIKKEVERRREREAKREAKKIGVDEAVESTDAYVKSAEEEDDYSGEDDDDSFSDHSPLRVEEIRSPILLLEECGTPIEPEEFSEDERSECFSLVLRLHHAGFVQNSLYPRNILRQPGPLSVRPSERSLKTPSFRIIDFGRGEFVPLFVEKFLETVWSRLGPPMVLTREEIERVKEMSEIGKEEAVRWYINGTGSELRKAAKILYIKDY